MLTVSQTDRIKRMRFDNESYNHIAKTLDVNLNTVKSYCRRNHLMNGAADKGDGVCKQCGMPVNHKPKTKPKKFCSDLCRTRWWNNNRNLMKKDAFYTVTCAGCGKVFESYGNKNRIYCSHDCYTRDRFGKKEDDHDTGTA